MTVRAVPATPSSYGNVVAQDLPPNSTPDSARTPAEPAMSDPTTEDLLRHRERLPASHPDRAALRDRAIEVNLPMARRLARRYAGRGEPLDDLTQVAAMALVKAVDGYDAARSTLFVSYAIPSIVGALKRHFRDTTWGMRVPRAMQELVLAVRTTSSELTHQFGRIPTPTELAGQLDVTLDRLLAAQAATLAYRPTSMDASLTGTDAVGNADLVRALGGPDPSYAAIEDRLTLRTLVAALPERGRRIVAMRFWGEMTQTQIAAELGLSQMHVSRLLRQFLARLRLAMTAPTADKLRATGPEQ